MSLKKKKFTKLGLFHVINDYAENEKECNMTNSVSDDEPCINLAIKNANNIEEDAQSQEKKDFL